MKLAFSSNDLRQKNTVLLLVQTENKYVVHINFDFLQNDGSYSNIYFLFGFRRSYYLLVAITQDGYLKFEEDQEEAAYGAEVKNRIFLNGK